MEGKLMNKEKSYLSKTTGLKNMQKCNNEKRELINFLENDRNSYVAEKNVNPSNVPILDHPYNLDDLKQELRIARETAMMLEETLESYENKILDSIADNGDLHQKIDFLKTEMTELRIKYATVKRQRNELRNKNDEYRGQLDLYKRSLSSSEREITYLNARLHVGRNT